MLHLELRDREGYVGELTIRNDGTGTRESGNYVFTINRVVGSAAAVRVEDGRVEVFPRLQLNAWDLVYRCLREVALGGAEPVSRARDNFEWLTRLDPVGVVAFYSTAAFGIGLMLGLLVGLVL